MDEKLYTITLADGTTILNLRLNGNNYISDVPVEASRFEDNCAPLTVTSDDGEVNEVHENAELVYVRQYGSEFWIAFRDLTPEEISTKQIRSDIEYLAMMTSVDL